MHNPEIDAKQVAERDLAEFTVLSPLSSSSPNSPQAALATVDGLQVPVSKRALRARTTIGTAHVAELLVPGAVVGNVVYLDDHGSPIVLSSRDMPFPAGRVGLRVALPRGGQLALIGKAAASPFTEEEARRAGAMVVEHRHCLTGLLDREGALPVRFEIETVLLSVGQPPPRVQTLPVVPPELVPLVDYADAQPDLFAELGDSLAAHLTEDHQDLLLTVARRVDASGELLAAGVRAVHAGGLTLDIVDHEGSRAVPVFFAEHLNHPHQFGAALRTLAFESRG